MLKVNVSPNKKALAPSSMANLKITLEFSDYRTCLTATKLHFWTVTKSIC